MAKKHIRNFPLWLQLLAIALGAYFAMFAMVVTVIAPERYDLKVGTPAPETIYATKDIEDTVTTQQLRDSAAANVEYSYRSVDDTITRAVMSSFSDSVIKVKALIGTYTDAQIEAMSDAELEAIGLSVGVPLTRDDISVLQTYPASDIDAVVASARAQLGDVMESTLPEGQEQSALQRISRQLSGEGYDSKLVSLAMSVVKGTLQPNMLIDAETTELNRDKARLAVEPQMCVKGEVVVRQGDILTAAQYGMLSGLGIIKDSDYDVLLFIGTAVLLLIIISVIALFIYSFSRDVFTSPAKMLLMAIIVVLAMGVSLLSRAINIYLMPVTLGLMLISTLIDQKIGIFINLMLGIIMSLFASTSNGFFSMAMFSILIMTVISGPVVTFILTRYVHRMAMLFAGLAVGVVNFVITMCVGLINSASVESIVMYALWAAGGGVLAAVVSIGLQPLLEWMFNLVTNAKLMELSNPNQPLLHRLLLEAPGTYHHSIIVANLAEAAAGAIGANALLARVGAYYHDVGKLKRPIYFKENQLGDNPHDRTDPRVSAAILTSHPKDGEALAIKARLPREIIDIIKQHHGDSPVLYFYDRAKKQYGDDIDISQFRYEGPCPERREAAIVMLADITEAGTRSLPSHEPQKIEQFIKKLIRDKMTDGQLDKSQLTFSDLDKISNAFITVLSGVFHERVEYPAVKLPPRGEENHDSKAE